MNNLPLIETPFTAEMIRPLHVGDVVLLSGWIYTARDAAHQRLADAIEAERESPDFARRASDLLRRTHARATRRNYRTCGTDDGRTRRRAHAAAA